MGRFLGAHGVDDGHDIPHLNKCPDCGCFFEEDTCPICGKVCPEEMRAGNRKAVKQKKRKRDRYEGRVTFLEWYHTWWAITLAIVLMPVLGIVLLITSPHEKWKKVLFVALAVVYMLVSTLGIGNIIAGFSDLFDSPVDTSVSEEQYRAEAVQVTAEQFYRTPEAYEDAKLVIELTVVGRASWTDNYYDDNVYYICEARGGSAYTVIVRDCLVDRSQKLITGDIVTVYGECGKELTVYDKNDSEHSGVCLNMAYVIIE